ncbi:MAG: hypothetical protein ACE5GT_05525, partial [Rhodospirillales bacterium]
MAETIHVEECVYRDPVAAFAGFRTAPFALLLDSALPGSPQGRHAFIAADPFRTLVAKSGEIE